MKLLVQPGDGIGPLLSAIKSAKKTIDILIFRMDWKELEAALKAASNRGVAVRALIAHTNSGGEPRLRSLEMRFLEAGIIVARTNGDLVRYHGKIVIIDQRTLFVLSYNFVHLDIEHSRAFGIVTKAPKVVQEAVKLFEADTNRQTYTPGLDSFVVSPLNAREELSKFIKDARKQLLIYDPKVSDRRMIRLLRERADAGVEIRIIGGVIGDLPVRPLTRMRLHTRAIIRDGADVFLGSQSLRQPELDRRREIGIIVHESKVVNGILKTFEDDWSASEDAAPPKKKPVRGLEKELQPLVTSVKKAIKVAVKKAGKEAISTEDMQATVRHVVKKAMKQAVREVGA